MQVSCSSLEARWLAIHVRCDGDTDALLREAISPLMRELQASQLIEQWFFLRYWEAGPHVRVRVASAPVHHQIIENQLLTKLGRWLSENDPQYPDAARAYDHIARVLADRENSEDTPAPWRAHGEVWSESYSPEFEKYGNGASLAAFEKHFCASSDIASSIIQTGATQAAKLSLSVLFIMVSWLDEDLNLGPGHQPREIFLERWKSVAPLDSRRSPRANQRSLHDLSQIAASGGGDLGLAWTRIMHELRHEVLRTDWAENWHWSGDICLHLLCNRLGLTLEQEYAVRRSASSVSVE